MKSKKIPVDIKAKSIKEAQNEVYEILEKLENNNTNLEDSMDQYNRMMQLNHYIQEQYSKKVKDIIKDAKEINKKAKEIRENIFKKSKKNLKL